MLHMGVGGRNHVGAGEVLALEQQGRAEGFRQGVGGQVAEVEAVAPLAVAGEGLEGDARLLFVERIDPGADQGEEFVEPRLVRVDDALGVYQPRLVQRHG